MFHSVRRVVAALLDRLRPFQPPADPYAAVPRAAPAESERPRLRYRSRRAGASE